MNDCIAIQVSSHGGKSGMRMRCRGGESCAEVWGGRKLLMKETWNATVDRSHYRSTSRLHARRALRWFKEVGRGKVLGAKASMCAR